MEAYLDFGSSDLKDIWDSAIDPEMQEALDGDDTDMPDWVVTEKRRGGVVLHDRLMTDAVVGAAPIKTEHSYSLSSDVESPPASPNNTKVDDMEEECFPAMPLKRAWSRARRSCCSPSPSPTPSLSATRRSPSPSLSPRPRAVKQEPRSEPESPSSSCPPSPAEPVQHLDYVIDHTTGSIHVPQSALQQVNVPQLLLSAAPRLAQSLASSARKLSIKLEPSRSGFSLPPTPPSSLSSSDSEGALSPPRGDSAPRRSHLYVSHHVSRQPINTPLISSQPKGSTGSLQLTEEEKRTLLAEGYPVPTRLPLTKAEEKSLKKIRRKIKNKISAQESRRKKKEYMDQLERKVELLISENSEYRKRMESLEQSNASLLSQLTALQAVVTRVTRK